MANWLFLLSALWASADPPPPRPGPVSPAEIVAALETALTGAIEEAEPSVVAIARIKNPVGEETTAVRGRNPAPLQSDPRLAGAGVPPPPGAGAGALVLARPFSPVGDDMVSFDYGSGVVIGDGGEILTAFHVVKGAQRLEVRAAGKQAFEAEVIAADPRSDLAVIVPRTGAGLAPPKLKPIAMGDAAKLRKGAFLVSLGNPFNAARDGRPSASWGILANVARRLEPSPEDAQINRRQLRNYPTLLQLDSKLNLGMSGGAVVNLNGEMVGLTTSIAAAAGFDAMAGYAIPVDAQGRHIIETLKQGKEYEYGFLGIGLDPNGSNRVESAQPGTPADLGNVLVGDQIVAVGDTPVTDADSLVLAINLMPAGSRVTLKIVRQDQVIERTVELAKYRVAGEVIATNRPPAWRGLRVDYTSTLPYTTFGDGLLTAMARGGVVITEVEAGSPAANADLKPGQIIRSVEGKTLRTPRDFLQFVAGLRGPVNVETDLGAVTIR
jgi:S1-C subfamily serine protease